MKLEIGVNRSTVQCTFEFITCAAVVHSADVRHILIFFGALVESTSIERCDVNCNM